eukprot:TRINITY_DN98_c1_g2_i4.p3 TRINITY_DN98_c1_g2~~TRINITY_DN98_c1_g2_i4.p3  ORF type:complete len:139 (+),score=18.95 TRINITY_DN98_c1_g2_i4:110-526(+)
MGQAGTRPDLTETARMQAAEGAMAPPRPASSSRDASPAPSNAALSARAPSGGPLSPRSAKNFDAGVVPSVGEEDRSQAPQAAPHNMTRILTDEELQRKLAVQELMHWAREERERKLGREFDADDVTESWKTVLAMVCV